MPQLMINGQKVQVGDEFMSLSPEDQAAEVDDIASSMQPPAEQTDPRQSLGAGFGSMIPGLSQASGGIKYALQGGAPGSYDQGVQQFDQRMRQAQADHPYMYRGGQALGLSTYMGPSGGGKIAARTLEETLRHGGKAAEKVSPLAAVLGTFMQYAGLRYGGRAAQRAADFMKGMRMPRTGRMAEEAVSEAPAGPAGFQGTGDPFSGPAPNASISELSPEMQAQSDAYQAFLRRHGR